ncbi:unnamed protein product [Symbiodinium sp. CCMP2592]|nr:unnamed protein product [Symbiodinium sp. CCMP2592]
MDMDYMDATLQVNAFGMTAGCTFCLDNLPNQLAVLGHFRAILEMCHNQCEGDSDQYESAKEVERQMKTVKLMIKMAQARSKSKAVKVEVMPCILSTSLNVNGEASASMGSMSPKKSMSMVGASATGSMFCGKLPKLDEGQRCHEEPVGSDSIASTSSMVPTETVAEKRDKESASASASPEAASNAKRTESGPSVGSATQKRPESGRSISSTQKAVEPVAPSAPSSSSSFASRLMPSFLRKNRTASKEKAQEVADGAMSPEALLSSAEVQEEPDEAAEAIPTLRQLQQGTQGQRLLPIVPRPRLFHVGDTQHGSVLGFGGLKLRCSDAALQGLHEGDTNCFVYVLVIRSNGSACPDLI